MNIASLPRAGSIAKFVRLAAGGAILAVSLVFIYKALHLFSFDPKSLGKYVAFKWIIMGHVTGGMGALLAGPFQLWKAFRIKYKQVHRVLGRVYVSAIALGAVCALILASTTALSVGLAYALSLHMLATVWLVTAFFAWRSAVKRKFKQHEEWARRSYIATVAFVAQSLLFELPVVARLGTFAETATSLIWFSWTVPMLVYDVTRLSRQPH